jgi:hypothetical protein
MSNKVPFNFDTMRVFRIMSVTQQLRTAPLRQGGFNPSAVLTPLTTSSTTDDTSSTAMGMLASLMNSLADNTASTSASDLFSSLRGSMPSFPIPGSGTSDGPSFPSLNGIRNGTTAVKPLGTLLASMLPDPNNFTMGPTSYDTDINDMLQRACQSCFRACLANMTISQRQSCADQCTNDCLDLTRPGAMRPFPTPSSSSSSSDPSTSSSGILDRKASATSDALLSMANVMSLSTPTFASGMLDVGTRGMMDSVFSYTQRSSQSSATTPMGTNRPKIVDTLINNNGGDGIGSMMNLFNKFNDGMDTGYSSLLSTISGISDMFTPSAASSLTLMGAIANGRATRTAAITSTYDSFHQFLLRGLADTQLFNGIMTNDTISLPDIPTDGPGLPSSQCAMCYDQCINQFKHSQVYRY